LCGPKRLIFFLFLWNFFHLCDEQRLKWVMIICSKFDCSKNLLDTILLLHDTVRAIIFFLVNCSTAVGNLLSCRINWIRAIYIFCVNCSNCRPIYIRTVDTVKTDINFARIAITRQKFIFKNTYGRN
jgi:hypothetical protein